MIFITHHLDEVMKEADSITIMRDGKTVHSCAKNDITTEKIISYMANRDVMRRKKSKRKVGNEIFIKAEHFSREDEYEDASFEVRKGEILCVAGLIGAGRTELFKTVFGLNKPKPGAELIIEGKKVNLKSHSPRESIRMGIGYVPEERRMMGIFPVLSVSENMMMPSYRQLTKNMAIQYREVEKQTEKYVKSMSIKTPSSAAQIRNLSGGNQQKVIVARWMAKGVKMLILDEPTRGIDVNAKDEIHNLITELADNGVTVVVISSEMEEVLALADRIMIMHDGQIKGFINETEGILEEDILKIALKGVIQ